MTGQCFVYIMTSKHDTVLHTGVTNDLRRRAYEHKEGLGGWFTSTYEVRKLVYYESTGDVHAAIAREKQIKGVRGKRRAISSGNPTPSGRIFEDLSVAATCSLSRAPSILSLGASGK
jgi:putative endonuclease